MELIIKHNDFKQTVYRFWLKDEIKLLLDSYWLQERKTKRHKFITVKQYNRILQRNNTIKLSDIPFNDEIKRAAKNQLFSQISVDI